jgi:hypothetical protein
MNSSIIIHKNICLLIHKKCHLKIYHSNVIYHMTLHIIFKVVCYDEVGLCAQNIDIVLASIDNIIERGPMQPF